MAEVTYLEAIRQGLQEEMARDENVFILGEDVGAYGGAFKVTDGLLAEFGEQRVIDTPISEAAIVGAAAGAAHMGLRPVAEMQFIDFISCAYDMLTNYVATARYRAGLPSPMVVRGPFGRRTSAAGRSTRRTPRRRSSTRRGSRSSVPPRRTTPRGSSRPRSATTTRCSSSSTSTSTAASRKSCPRARRSWPRSARRRVAREGTDLSIITWSAMV